MDPDGFPYKLCGSATLVVQSTYGTCRYYIGFIQCCGTGTGTVGTVTFCLVEPEPELVKKSEQEPEPEP
jgi:hypothetical protein